MFQSNLEAIELKNIYGLNPLAKEFVPKGKYLFVFLLFLLYFILYVCSQFTFPIVTVFDVHCAAVGAPSWNNSFPPLPATSRPTGPPPPTSLPAGPPLPPLTPWLAASLGGMLPKQLPPTPASPYSGLPLVFPTTLPPAHFPAGFMPPGYRYPLAHAGAIFPPAARNMMPAPTLVMPPPPTGVSPLSPSPLVHQLPPNRTQASNVRFGIFIIVFFKKYK